MSTHQYHPVSSQYRLSADFEREVRADLEQRGYLAVRAAGSEGVADGVRIDLIALYPEIGSEAYFAGEPLPARGAQLVIQCQHSGNVPQVDRFRLIRVARKYGCVPVIASKTEQGIKYDFLPR